jgi:TRAP transporter TAXI family solute receptor
MFEGKPLRNIRVIAALYPETLQLVISKESGIKSINDLKGKRVGVGAPGSGTEGDVRTVFQAVGLGYGDMSVDFLDFGSTSSRFKDNQIDAGFIVGGVPTSALMDLTSTEDISLLSFDKDTLDTIIKTNPFFVENVIPAGTYRGIDTDVSTLSVMAILITNWNVSEDVIYNFTKALFENINDIRPSHVLAGDIGLTTATAGLSAPLHSGAAKFYNEKGLDVTDL